ncbi:hypothetical protein BDZ89DRAFT_1033124 [Hymenopellis radicata]|nr:hypothetical protein BDZ89DRAFT_1033124 [Hymenopellis radicata]
MSAAPVIDGKDAYDDLGKLFSAKRPWTCIPTTPAISTSTPIKLDLLMFSSLAMCKAAKIAPRNLHVPLISNSTFSLAVQTPPRARDERTPGPKIFKWMLLSELPRE